MDVEKRQLQEKVNHLAMQLQIMQAENQENQQCIKKLKEVITDKEQHIENL